MKQRIKDSQSWKNSSWDTVGPAEDKQQAPTHRWKC